MCAGYVVEDAPFYKTFTSRAAGNGLQSGYRELDKSGRLSRTVALDAPQQSQPEQLTFEAEVQDLTQQTQAGRANVLVHPAQFYLGLNSRRNVFSRLARRCPLKLSR